MSSDKISDKIKRFVMNLIEHCKTLRAYSIPSDLALNAKISKMGSTIKKILKNTALVEQKMNEYSKTPTETDGTRNAPQSTIEEDMNLLKAKLVRRVNKFKTLFASVTKDIIAREKEVSSLNKSLDETTTNFCKQS